jgi:signal transduction histidine kinase/ligand-binding sensor domain-containing protein/DNA-binding response OmpR family regulator
LYDLLKAGYNMMLCWLPTGTGRKCSRILMMCWLTFFSVSAAASPFPALSFLNIEQGLSNNTVRSIFQDHNGFLWFGTFDGLNRYDGYGFKVFRNKAGDNNSLVHNIILSITEDSLHNCWIGTRQGLSRLEPLSGRFTTIQWKSGDQPAQPLNAVVRDVKADKHNNLFIATESLGLLLCPQGSIQAQPIPLVKSASSILQYGVKAIRVDGAGNTWVLVQQYGLALYDTHTRQLKLVNESLPDAAWLEVVSNSLWIASGTAIYSYSPAANALALAFDYHAQQADAGAIVAFSLDKDHTCWIGTVLGKLLVWKPGDAKATTCATMEDPYSYSSVGLHTLYIDQQSRKWIGTARGGVGVIDPRKGRFQTIAHQPGNSNSLVDNMVSALYEAPDGKLYVGTDGAGLSIWDRSNNQFTSLRNEPGNSASLSDNAITAIKADHAQNIWIATFRQGINRLDPATHKVKRYMPINPLSKKVDRVTYALLEDHDRRLWLSTLRQGSEYGALYLFNTALNRFEAFDSSLSDLFTLYEDSKGELWGGNLTQLVKIDPLNKKHQFYNIGYAVRSIYEDKSGNCWVGTEGGGLLLFDRNTKKIAARYTTENGLCSDVVLTILEGAKGQLWMSTFNGLSVFDVVKHTFKNYYQADGLQSNQFHYTSALALRSGELAFGGIRGMNVFRPAEITPNHSMPPLLLSDLSVNNTPVENDTAYISQMASGKIAALTVPYSKAVFSFRYTALEYTVPGKIAYAYFMEGWDRGWNYTGNIRLATYTHLDEGTYTFRVKSTNGEGEWNPQQIAIRITVLPPWYRSWWAWALYAMAVLGALYVFVSYKMRQNRLQYEIKLAHLQAKEAQLNVQKEKEVNEKRLAFFTNVSHEFRTPLTLIIDPVKEMLNSDKEAAHKEGLSMVYRNARRLLSLVDQLLLFRKAETDSDSLRLTELNAAELCREVFFSFVQQARIKKIDYHIEGADEPVTLYADREKLEIILFNLLSNAVKFTPSGGKITLKLTEAADTVAILVTDSGPGIPPEVGDKLFNRFYQVKSRQSSVKAGFGIGLYLVKHFTSLHHGQVAYESTPGEGASFTLTLQKGTAHFKGAEVFTDEQPQPVFAEEGAPETESMKPDKGKELVTLVTEIPTILIVDDDEDLRKYVSQVFSKDFNILQAVNGREGLTLAQQYLPDLIISDITMEELGGMDLCRQLKEDPALSHIPIILLTASTASETRLQGIEAGADDYVTKPFEKELLKARVISLLKKRNSLQQYFYNEITLQKNDGKVSVEYREFLDKCIKVVESHLDDETFSIKTLTTEMGMSRSSLYRKVNSVSGQSIIGFIRFIRLRKAAELMINTENNINEIASITGFNDIKYFRQHFSQLFGMNPSEYIRKFRKPFHNNLQLNKNIRKPE